MCRALKKAPHELAEWDETMWSWAIHNVIEDIKEREKLLFSFMDTLTWWLQPELKSKVENEKKGRMPDANLEQYAKDLREGGATEEYVAKELEEIRKEQRLRREAERLSGREDDDDDAVELLRGPRT